MKEFTRRIIVYLLTLEARAVLKKYDPRIIVITGSVGKSSAKDALYAALSSRLFVRKSEKNYNGDIGVPLTILGVPNGWRDPIQWLRNIADGLLLLAVGIPYPRWLILEVGADRPGDISERLSWLSPDVVITTSFPDIPVHVEFYPSPAAVIKEELAPVSFLKKGGAIAVNADDHNTEKYLPRASYATIVRYGFSKDADVRALRYRVLSRNKKPCGIAFDLVAGDGRKKHIVRKGIIGRTHAYATLAAAAGAIAAGFDAPDFPEEEQSAAPYGRLRLIEGTRGTIIDDSYNASPAAMKQALDALRDAPTVGKRIAVLADMLELGSHSTDEHKGVGKYATGRADTLVTVGVRARTIAHSAIAQGFPETNVHSFETQEDAVRHLLQTVKDDDTVLVKGSQSMRMERVVKALMAHPEKAGELLPRQDKEWQNR